MKTILGNGQRIKNVFEEFLAKFDTDGNTDIA